MHLTPEDLASLRKDLTALARSGRSLESIGRTLVQHLRTTLRDEQGQPALALVRFYADKTFTETPSSPQRVAERQ